MYSENSSYESDLLNSYAWDTAIVFIEKYSGNSNYANQAANSLDDDVVCNIREMASLGAEWTTEHSTVVGPAAATPGVVRAGDSYNVLSPVARGSARADVSGLGRFCFRVILY